MKHIPSRHFSFNIDFMEKFRIQKEYSESKWEYAKFFLSETQKITKSALKIVEVIKHNFNIVLFPSVFKVATKGWDAGCGTAYFMMYGENGKTYTFQDPANKFKAKNGNYKLSDGEFYRIS